MYARDRRVGRAREAKASRRIRCRDHAVDTRRHSLPIAAFVVDLRRPEHSPGVGGSAPKKKPPRGPPLLPYYSTRCNCCTSVKHSGRRRWRRGVVATGSRSSPMSPHHAPPKWRRKRHSRTSGSCASLQSAKKSPTRKKLFVCGCVLADATREIIMCKFRPGHNIGPTVSDAIVYQNIHHQNNDFARKCQMRRLKSHI